MMEGTNKKHRAGFVNIIGNPNVGKSTLMNALVGEKLSIVTAKAQTTRHRIMGIVNTDDYQIVYSDTPGILKPNYRLQQNMMKFVETAIGDADIILYVTDVVETGDKNAFTDRNLRFFASEIIREKILLNYDKEIPYCCEVAIEEFKEGAQRYEISAVIYVMRDSQKGILIGKGGAAMKRLGTQARIEMEDFFQRKVFLRLFVKVDEDWRTSRKELRRFGYED